LGFELPPETYKPEVNTEGKIIGEAVGTNGSIYVLFQVDDTKTIINKSSLTIVDDRLNKVWNTNRNPIKVGRLMTSILTASKIPFTQQDIEKFVNDYKSTIDILNNAFNRFDIVEGDDIVKWYEEDRYSEKTGPLGSSCMASAGESILELYSNGKNVQLVILYDENGTIEDGKYKSDKICGRALLWKLLPHSTLPGSYFMDRIYTNNDSDVELYKKYADKMDWWCKKTQSSGVNFTAQKGSQTTENFKLFVYIGIQPDQYPYVDTIYYYDNKEYLLSNVQYDRGIFDADYILNDTEGGYEPIDQENQDDDY
jgi:hypothetical protein